MKPKTIFITGGTGFVGSNLSYELLKHGYKLKLLARGENAKQRIEKLFNRLFDQQEEYNRAQERLEVIKGDVTKENLGIPSEVTEKISHQIDAIFHCAASTSFEEAKREEIEKQNIEGAKNILEFALRLGNPEFHFMSTAYVCGNKKGIFYEDELDAGQEFNNYYEESKLQAEKLIKEYEDKFNIKAVIYRPAIIVGNSKTGRTSNFLGFYSLIGATYLLLKLFKEDLNKGGKRALKAGVSFKGKELHIPLRVPAIANKTLNIVPIDYVIDVIMKIYKSQSGFGKTYNIVNPNPPTIGYIQRAVCLRLDISGIKIVDPKEFTIAPMTPWEEFFIKYIKSFSPYLQQEEPIFSDRNTQEILNGTHIKCPYISEKLISKLIDYSIENNWGRK